MKTIEVVEQESAARIKRRLGKFDERSDALTEMRAGSHGADWRKIDEPARIARRAASIGMNAAAADLLANPDDQILGRQILEQIIDANNLLEVRFLADGAKAAKAVGQVRLPVSGGTRLGTGFMVTSRLMMTNNHVLQSATEAANALLRFDFFRRADGSTVPVMDFALRPDWFFLTNDELDFSIVAVTDVNPAGAQVAQRGWLPLIGQSGKAVVGERVNIIQHPGGLPQQVAIHENLIVDIDDDWLRYVTDTQGGSSGSPVLNDQWELAALHHAATTIDGGRKANEGARISRIVAWLQAHFASESVSGASVYQAELLSGDPPSTGLMSPIGLPVGNRSPATVGPDGTATWVIPVSVSVRLGDLPMPSLTESGPADAMSDDEELDPGAGLLARDS